MSAQTPDLRTLVDRHAETLRRAVEAVDSREYWSPHAESPKAYGDPATARTDYERHLNNPFPLPPVGTDRGVVGGERSPYGPHLGVRYPAVEVDELLHAARRGVAAWRDAGPQVRASVGLEVLARLNARSLEMGHAVMHTSGQPFLMAFQAGGPHAQDRGLEALALAYAEMTRIPEKVLWEKPGRTPVAMEKTFTVVPRGVALVVGCNTFPTWNSYSGLFASLVTGNPVVVKPHPNAILPLAITVAVARDVLAESGFDPDLVLLAAEEPAGDLASRLATHPDVRIIDFTGSTTYGDWLEANARQARVYSEKAGVNSVVIDSTDDFGGLCQNLALSLSLYSGQMCTAPQNLLIPRDGIRTNDGHKSFDEVVAGIAAAVDRLLAEPARAVEVTGAIANDSVLERVDKAPSLGTVLLASRAIEHPAFPAAVVRTPTIIGVTSADTEVYSEEVFGPVAFAVATGDTRESIEILRRTVRERGAITASAYSDDEAVLDDVLAAAYDVGVAVSFNLTGPVMVNQTAAFSDFHGTGANPAATASYADPAFVAERFRIIGARRHVGAAA